MSNNIFRSSNKVQWGVSHGSKQVSIVKDDRINLRNMQLAMNTFDHHSVRILSRSWLLVQRRHHLRSIASAKVGEILMFFNLVAAQLIAIAWSLTTIPQPVFPSSKHPASTLIFIEPKLGASQGSKRQLCWGLGRGLLAAVYSSLKPKKNSSPYWRPPSSFPSKVSKE